MLFLLIKNVFSSLMLMLVLMQLLTFLFQFRDDLMRAIKKLKVMGSGFGMIPVGGSYLVQSVPAELNMDHTVVLQLAEVAAVGEAEIITRLI